jgi:hypothetical protein
MILEVELPIEPFNKFVRDGTASQKIQKILEAIKPEATYFTEQDGHRGAMIIINMTDASQIPAFAEPWFLTFNAKCKFRIAMTPEDLAKSGLDKMAKAW